MRTTILSSNSRCTTLLALLAACALAVAACDSGGNASSGSSGEDPMSMGSSSGGDDNTEKASGDDKVPPTGPASIDHGGITEIPDDPKLVQKGEKLFNDNGCTACHKMNKSQVGPALGGVTERREPEWIAKMIMHPRKMLSNDPTAKKLLREHGSRMANQGIKPDEAKAIIAWLATQSAE